MPLGRYSDDDTSPPSPGRPSAALRQRPRRPRRCPPPSSPARYPPLLTSNHPPPPSGPPPLPSRPDTLRYLYPLPCCALSVSPFRSLRTGSDLVAPSPYIPCLVSLLPLSLLSVPPAVSPSLSHPVRRNHPSPPSSSRPSRRPVLLNGENYQMRFPSGSKHGSRNPIA